MNKLCKNPLSILCTTLLCMGSAGIIWGVAPATHHLFIMLDYGQSEELQRSGQKGPVIDQAYDCPLAQMGAITSTLLPVLYQQQVPCIISKSLLYSLMARKQIFKDAITLDINQLHKKYRTQAQTLSRAPSLSIFKRHCLYAEKMYNDVNKTLRSALVNGTEKEVSQARNKLAQHPAFQAENAPRTLGGPTGSNNHSLLHKELQVYALSYFAPVSTDTYVFKDLSQELVLLIPRTLIGSASTSTAATPTLTPLEKQLGLKINHLSDLADIHNVPIGPPCYAIDLVDALKKVCVSSKEAPAIRWSIYATGHGLPRHPVHEAREQLRSLQEWYKEQDTAGSCEHAVTQHTIRSLAQQIAYYDAQAEGLTDIHEHIICSLKLPEFRKLLQCLDTHLTTSLFTYASCFAGGAHLTLPYTQNTAALSYDVIAATLTDEVSSLPTPMLLLPPYRMVSTARQVTIEGIAVDSIDPQKKRLVPWSDLRSDLFVKAAQDKTRDPFRMIQHLHPYIEEGRLQREALHNVALFRPAQTQTFIVLGPATTLPLAPDEGTIPATAGACLFDKPAYQQITMQHHLPFVSLLPGKAFHVIDYLATPGSLEQLVQQCTPFPTLASPKLYWIKQAACGTHQRRQYKDVIVSQSVQTTAHCHHRAPVHAYYTDQRGTVWHTSQGHQTPVKSGPLYNELFFLFPGLKSKVKLQADRVRNKSTLPVKAPLGPRAHRRIPGCRIG